MCAQFRMEGAIPQDSASRLDCCKGQLYDLWSHLEKGVHDQLLKPGQLVQQRILLRAVPQQRSRGAAAAQHAAAIDETVPRGGQLSATQNGQPATKTHALRPPEATLVQPHSVLHILEP